MPDIYARSSALLSVVILGAIFYVLFKAYNTRKFIHRLREQGLPMPPFNWITGHMLAMKPFMEKFPTYAGIYHAVTELALSLEKEAFYLDLWPLSEPLLILTTPAMTSQLTQEFSPPKPSVIKKALAKLTGDPDLFNMPDVQCKRWEVIFNTGSSPNFLFQQTPKIVDECRIFCEKMRARAQENQIFSLEKDSVRLALDVIGVVTLDTHLKYQQSTSRITESLRKLIEYTSCDTEVSPFKRWNPIRLYNLWYHGRKINRYIEAELDKRFLELQHSQNPKRAPKTAKPLITLALDAYLADEKATTTSLYSPYLPTLDPTFKRTARTHLRHLLLTTTTRSTTTIAHTLHLLSTHPPSLSRLRAEHNRVFGTATSAAPDRVGALLAAVPGLLNHLPYTTACVNEALRLSAARPALGLRVGGGQKGEKGIVLVGSDGTRYPTAGCKVVLLDRDGRRDPAALMHPDVFMPERWMPAATAGSGDALRLVEGGWWPVEGGGWDGVGRAVVVAEVKILLAMCARAFEFCAVDGGWDRLDWSGVRGIGTALGERGLRVRGGGGGAFVANRYLCWVRMAVYGKEERIR